MEPTTHRPLKVPRERFFQNMLQTVREYGGDLQGDAHTGIVIGRVQGVELEGAYEITEEAVSITILRKPSYVPTAALRAGLDMAIDRANR